jgi:hypothetical protein
MVDDRMVDIESSGETDVARESRLDRARHAASNAAHRARERATEMAHRAGDRANQALDEQKGRVASRLSRMATSMRDASHCFADNDEAGLGDYVEKAADRIEDLGDYLQEHRFEDLRHEAAMFLRRHPEIGLAGAVVGGILLGRFLRASTQNEFDDEADYRDDDYGYDGDRWLGDDEYTGSAPSSFAGAGAVRASYGPGSGVITPVGRPTSAGPTAPGHAMAHGGTMNRQGAEAGENSPGASSSSRAQTSSRPDTGGESCGL